MEYAVHPAAEIFPPMTEEEFAGLVADIKEHGQRDLIVLYDGAVLDGRNRLRACQALGIEPRFEDWPNSEDPQTYVVSKNLHRRHLNTSQRAMVAGRIANIELGQVGGGHPKTDTQKTASEAASLLNIATGTVDCAKVVLRDGTREEIEAIESGRASVSPTAKQIRKRAPKKQPKKKKTAALSQTGKNPERIERRRINAEIWGHVRDALTHLTSLPLPADVVSIARANDRAGLIDERLAQSLNWLKDFENEWSHRDQTAA